MEAENIKVVVVIGAGIMGQGIAQSFAQAGLLVRVVDIDRERLDRCLAQIDANLALFQEFDLLRENPSSIRLRINPVLANHLIEAVQNSDFVVEAIPENLELKRQLFVQLDSCRDEIILSSNTSSLTISAIVEKCRSADRIIGLHYFNPAHIMPLVEIHYCSQTRSEVIATTKALMLRAGKKPIIVRKEIPGFIVNRIQAAMMREIEYLITESIATPEDIDEAAKASYGFRHACIGNIEAYDMIGLDTALAVGKYLYKELSNSTEPLTMLKKVQSGELGIKSGRGFYDYAGKLKEKIIEDQNRRLLHQLASYKSLNKGT